MPKTIAHKIIEFNQNLHFAGKLPNEFRVINPYLDNPETLLVMEKFYHTYYNDSNQRKFMVGINPSRHGAGVTGVPFTDTKRLEAVCGIPMKTAHTHEISSVFIYDMIADYGGVKKFYQKFYINSPFPLAIVRQKSNGNWVNANYYDDASLFKDLKDFMITTLKNHIALGLDTKEVFVLGKKNAIFIDKLNQEAELFNQLTVLEHPRYIQQYKSKEKQLYIDKYILALEQESL